MNSGNRPESDKPTFVPSLTTQLGLLIILALSVLYPSEAGAIPAFARRYGFSCHTCHEFHYPRLNTFGERFKRNGYQLADGAEDAARGRRTLEPGTIFEALSVFKEVPLSVRGSVSGELKANDDPEFTNSMSSFLSGGGSVAKDVSFFFSWSPFPTAMLHHANIGVANMGKSVLGEGSLNLRAGLLLLLDFARPAHRTLAPGFGAAGGVAVGNNPFRFDDSSLGVELQGRPHWGPFAYEVAVLAGPPGATADIDDWKDGFARVSYTFFQNTAHELALGAFGYLGRADIETAIGGVTLAQRDDFWVGGMDLEADYGPFDLSGMGYASQHSDPDVDGKSVDFFAMTVQGTLGITPRLVASLRFDWVESEDNHDLRVAEISPHVSYLLATNVLTKAVWRQDLRDSQSGVATVLLETAF